MAKRRLLEAALGPRESDNGLTGDHADFHNLAAEAMRANLSDLGLVVLEMALQFHPGNPVLVGDYVQTLRNLGRTRRAIEVAIDFWLTVAPRKFASDWRVCVFFKDCVEQTDPSFDDVIPVDIAKELKKRRWRQSAATLRWGEVVEAMFRAVVDLNPRHIKVWHGLAEVRQARGDEAGAIAVLEEGLAKNPLSQELRFALGELSLLAAQRDWEAKSDSAAISRVALAIRHLEDCLTTDFQLQFQPDVNVMAVMLRLAQAYEAKGLLTRDEEAIGKAEAIYSQAIGAEGHFGRYAQVRLRQIGMYHTVRDLGSGSRDRSDRSWSTPNR
jgi:tetratricopeptide (TPR) repeat protein